MQVKIYKPIKFATKSVNSTSNLVLELTLYNRFKEFLIGKTSSNDMMSEIKIRFPSYQESVAFAEKNNYDYDIIEPQRPRLINKSYVHNFQ